MAGPYASASILGQTDGVTYASSALMPGAEGDLYNGTGIDQSPPAVLYGLAVQASVQFTFQGNVGSDSAYVVMQTGFGDGNWFDVAWCNTSVISGTPLYYLASGRYGPNVFQQSRTVGTAPGPANSYNTTGVLGQIRFVGKATVGFLTSSSSLSAVPGVIPGVYVTIRYKLEGHR